MKVTGEAFWTGFLIVVVIGAIALMVNGFFQYNRVTDIARMHKML